MPVITAIWEAEGRKIIWVQEVKAALSHNCAWAKDGDRVSKTKQNKSNQIPQLTAIHFILTSEPQNDA